MPVSSRVREDPFSKNAEAISREHAIDLVRGTWRIYAYHNEYSTTSGGFMVKDSVARRYDPDAGLLEGKPAAFPSKEGAVAYWERWIKPHERLRA